MFKTFYCSIMDTARNQNLSHRSQEGGKVIGFSRRLGQPMLEKREKYDDIKNRLKWKTMKKIKEFLDSNEDIKGIIFGIDIEDKVTGEIRHTNGLYQELVRSNLWLNRYIEKVRSGIGYTTYYIIECKCHTNNESLYWDSGHSCYRYDDGEKKYRCEKCKILGFISGQRCLSNDIIEDLIDRYSHYYPHIQFKFSGYR